LLFVLNISGGSSKEKESIKNRRNYLETDDGNEASDAECDNNDEGGNEVNSEEEEDNTSDIENKDIVFSKIPTFEFNFENPTADALLTVIVLQPERFKQKTPLKGIRTNKMFTLEGFDHNGIMCDDNGAYKNTKTVKKFYHVSFTSDLLKTKTVHQNDMQFFFKERQSRRYVDVIAPENEVYIIERIYRDSKSFNGLKHMVVRVKRVDRNEYEKHCLVVYSMTKGNDGEEQLKPHGNAKKTNSAYIRTTRDTLEREEELLELSRPSMVYYDLVRESDPYTSLSQSSEPRNLKQVQNKNYHAKKKTKVSIKLINT